MTELELKRLLKELKDVFEHGPPNDTDACLEWDPGPWFDALQSRLPDLQWYDYSQFEEGRAATFDFEFESTVYGLLISFLAPMYTFEGRVPPTNVQDDVDRVLRKFALKRFPSELGETIVDGATLEDEGSGQMEPTLWRVLFISA